MARDLIATDLFERASLGTTDWTQLNTFDGSVQITGSSNANGSANGHPTARWVGAGAFTDNQYAEVEIADLANLSAAYYVGPIVRASGDVDGARDYYFAVVAADGGGPTYGTTIGKTVNGTVTALHSGAVTWANGDLLSIEVDGTTLTACKNGTPLGGSFTQTSQTDLTTGLPGILCSGSQPTAEAWYAGNLTAGGGGDGSVEKKVTSIVFGRAA